MILLKHVSDHLLHGPHQSWKVLESPGIQKSPGVSWKVLEFCRNFGKALEIFCGETIQKRFLSKHQHFSDFLCMLNLAIHGLTAMIFILGILDAIISIYSQHVTG